MKTYGKILLAVMLLVSASLYAQVPVMSSYPSAPSVIFLDFDGHLVNGTSWNMSGPIDCGPSNLPVDKMTEIYHRVAEDYRPFNVNVTTDSTRYWAAPATQRMRVILTISSSWYGSAGGVSYMGSFTWGDNTPAFVFTQLLGYNAKNIGEAAAHEAGHTLGLRHQSSYDGACNKTAEYNAGVGSGETAWAPIMGVGYYRNLTLWNNGANPYGCTNFQDDLGVITSYNGFSYRPDDVGNAVNSSTTVNFTNNVFNASGVIERSTDQDVFRFIMPVQGTFKLDAVPFNIGAGNVAANLDLQVELLSKNGSVLATYNPLNQLNTVVDTNLTAGTYFIRLRGRGNSFTSEYASLGSYNVQGRIVAGEGNVLPVRKLQLSGAAQSGKHQLSWEVDADEAVTSQTVEVSTDGTNFTPVAQPTSTTRSFSYQPATTTWYRIHVGFANGQQHYTNLVMLRGAAAVAPRLSGNLVQNRLVVNSPAAFDYIVTDYSGRVLQQGAIRQGQANIETSRLSAGLYLVQFSNGKEQYTERFMKQ